MDFTGERCIIGKTGKVTEKEHKDRYVFVKNFVKDKIVLDVACGTGYGTQIISENAKIVYGVDISSESIKYAEENYKLKNNSFHVSDATKIQFLENKSIDIVVSFETIEHLENYIFFLKEIKRVLKDNGLAIISTPNKKYSEQIGNKPKNTFHVIEFTKNEFIYLLSKEFHEIKIFGQDVQTIRKGIMKAVVKLVPQKIRKMILSEKIRDKYSVSMIDGITDRNVDFARYFIGICKNIN